MNNSIKRLRETAKLTQAQFARKLAISTPTIIRYENSEREPRWSDISAMCRLFNCTAEELMSPPGESPILPSAPPPEKPGDVAAEIAEFRHAINDLFPELEDKQSYADILLDLSDNGRVDAPEMRGKLERGARALLAALD